MIGKFSRIKEINQFYCAGLLPSISPQPLSLLKTQRSNDKTSEGSPPKDRVLTLEKMRERLRKQIQGTRSHTIGTVQNSAFSQKTIANSFSKTEATDSSCRNSRIHTITDSPVFAYQKGKEFFKRQSLYSHKVKIGADQAKNQSKDKDKQYPMFSIKLLKAFLKNDGILVNNDSVTPKLKTLPTPQNRQEEESKLKFNLKSIDELQMNVTEIRIKNSIFPKKYHADKNLPCFIVKRSIQKPRQFSKPRQKKNLPSFKIRPKKSFLSERTSQETDVSTPPLHKKYSEEISEDLIELSSPRNHSFLTRSRHTQPSLSAWD